MSVNIDQARLKTIIEAEHSYYGSRPAKDRRDRRLNPGTSDFITSQFRPEMRVLDTGCGSGATLLDNSHCFASGLGIDNDPDHVRLAQEALRKKDAANVEFRVLDFIDDNEKLEPGSFDFVFSERGPVGYKSFGIQAALRVLKCDGILFCEVIGDLHHQEVREVFGRGPRLNQTIRTLDQAKVAMERNGVAIRIAADIVEKRYYPNIYEWLQFQCSIWAWGGRDFPAPDDIRLTLFAERNTTPSGEIETTHHRVWVGGVKLAGDSHYDEAKYFDK